jgi:uncharacterized OsmC-like protein
MLDPSSRTPAPAGRDTKEQSMTVTDAIPATPNGVAIDAIREARQAMTDAPEAARFTWRARNRWVSGTHSMTSFEDFYGVGAEQTHKRVFTFDADHPELFAADDLGPTPVEFVLHALAACLTAGIASVAANRGVQLAEVSSTLEGDMDLRGILDIDRDVRNGYSTIRVSFDIKGDTDADALRSVVAQATARSAVYDVITGAVGVEVSVTT